MSIESQVRLYALDSRELGAAALARFAAKLDAAETARAARFVFDKHRRRFIAAHGFLREVLARELSRESAALEFEFGLQGKPRVKHAQLHFSLTHTGEHALVAVAGFELGLDAEEIRATRVDAPLARRVMTPEEFESWSQAPREVQVLAFFRLWSAKESVMKASGQGMTLGPDSFAVFLPGSVEVGASVEVDGRVWSPRTLESSADLALALATDRALEIVRDAPPINPANSPASADRRAASQP